MSAKGNDPPLVLRDNMVTEQFSGLFIERYIDIVELKGLLTEE